jgi:DNA gyrase subunit B
VTSADPEPGSREQFRHDGGIAEFVDFLAAPTSRSPTPSGCQGMGTFTETVPILDDAGQMTPGGRARTDVDIAVRWGNRLRHRVLRSFVNIIATPKGGTHVTGFERALTRTFNERLDAGTKALKAATRTSSRTTCWRA